MANNKIQINRVTNANVYLDGNSFLGRALQIDLPSVKTVTSEHAGLGLIGKLDYPSGLDKMQVKIQWNSFYKEVLAKTGNPFTAIQLQVRSSMETFEGGSRTDQVPFVAYLTVQPTDFPLGSFKPNDNVEVESNLNCTAARVEIDGEEILAVDIEAGIWRASGVDLMAQYRNNLGIN